MPRKTLSPADREAAARERYAKAFAVAVAEAVAQLPFSPLHAADSPHAYANLPTVDAKTGKLPRGEKFDLRYGVAASIYRDFKSGGLSGAECRAKYGGTNDATDGTEIGLSGRRRRIVLRQYGEFADGVARSYEAFADGSPRTGSGHAREHGVHAAERQAEAARQEAEATAAKLAQDAKDAQRESDRRMRDALRAAGQEVPRSAAKMRAAYAACIAAEEAEESAQMLREEAEEAQTSA